MNQIDEEIKKNSIIEEEKEKEEEKEEEIIIRKPSLPKEALVNPFLPKSKTSISTVKSIISPKESRISVPKKESIKQPSIHTSPIQNSIHTPETVIPDIKQEKEEEKKEEKKEEEKEEKHPEEKKHNILTNVMKQKMKAVGVVENQIKRNKEYTNIGFVLDYLTTNKPMTIPVCEISLFKKDDPSNLSVEYTSPPAIIKDGNYVWEKIQV